jgi:hypothetical protein
MSRAALQIKRAAFSSGLRNLQTAQRVAFKFAASDSLDDLCLINDAVAVNEKSFFEQIVLDKIAIFISTSFPGFREVY